jgi:hypothetical protein
MKYLLTPINKKYADDIVSNWHYDDVYSFYDSTSGEGIDLAGKKEC